MIRIKVGWCPHNGCGRPNGAAPPAPVTCVRCKSHYLNYHKLCPSCRTCSECGRVGKRFFGRDWR